MLTPVSKGTTQWVRWSRRRLDAYRRRTGDSFQQSDVLSEEEERMLLEILEEVGTGNPDEKGYAGLDQY